MQAIEVALEGIDVRRPPAAERRQPGVHLLQGCGSQAVDTPLRVDGRFDEAGLAQDAQVLRDRRLRHSQLPLDVADRLRGRDEQAEDGTPVRVGNDRKRRIHCLVIRRCVYTCQGIYVTALQSARS